VGGKSEVVRGWFGIRSKGGSKSLLRSAGKPRKKVCLNYGKIEKEGFGSLVVKVTQSNCASNPCCILSGLGRGTQ